MAGLLRAVSHHATTTCSGKLTGGVYVDLLRSFAVLHATVYKALSASQTDSPARLFTSTPAQQHGALQEFLPLHLGLPAVYLQAPKKQHRLLGQPQAVVAVLGGPSQEHEHAVATASNQLIQLLCQTKHAAHEGGRTCVYQAQQLAESLHLHTQQAATPVEQLLQLLEAASGMQELPVQLTQALVQSLIFTMPDCNPQQLAAALNAAASIPGALRGNKAVLAKAVTAYLKQHQHAFDAASTAGLAAALGRCRQHRSFSLLSMLAMDHVQQMSPQQLVQLLSAFADAQHYNRAIMGAAAKMALALLKQQHYKLSTAINTELQDNPDNYELPTATTQQQAVQNTQDGAQAVGHVRSLTADDLAQLLSCCARLRHHDAQLLEAAAIAVGRSLKSMDLQQVVQVVTACAKLNHYSTGLFEEACRLVQQAVSEQQQPSQDAPAAAELTSKADNIGINSSSRVVQQGRSNNKGTCAAEDRDLVSTITDLAWSCVLMGHLDVPFWQLVAAWSSRLHLEDVNEEQLLQWHQIQTYHIDAAVYHPDIRSQGLSNHLLIAAQDAWMQKLQGQSLTPFHKEVHEALKQAGTRCRLNVALDGPLIVDVALHNCQLVTTRSRTALQLETPTMFAANPPHAALGPTAARWRALQSRGWKVISLRYSDWRRLKTADERALHMWHIREAIIGRALGVAPELVQMAAAAGSPENGIPTASSLVKKLWNLWKFIEG